MPCGTYLNSIGCQEKYALEVLELTQEDAHKSVPVNILHVPLFQEDISFIKEQNCTPCVTNIQDLLQFMLEEPGVSP
jgi:hypothetical protein